MSEENPWTHRSTKVVYENRWMRLREDEVLQPSGQPGIYAFIEKGAATGVVALTEKQEVYLVGQYRYPMEEYSWEIIEGGAEIGESPLEAAKRELQEEAGLVAEQWKPLGGEIHLSNCVTSERGYLYLAEGLSSAPAAPEDTEILQVKKMPLREAIESVMKGEIRDSLTIIALLTLGRMLGI